MAILAIDAGTTGVTALVVSETGEVLSRGYREFLQYFPRPGMVEHEPEEIWQAVLAAATEAVSKTTQSIAAIGITNQRETIALWDRKTLKSPIKAIVWQDRRSSEIVDELKEQGLEEKIRSLTGLGLDPYFSSSKLLWLSRNQKELWEKVTSGELAIGTIDSYLIARMTAGNLHVTDASNASRTQLLDIENATWNQELLEIFDVPLAALGEVVPSFLVVGHTDPACFLNLKLPIAGIAGDQQAALFGQTAFEAGEIKCTFGTGAFLLTNTGERQIKSSNGLLTTIAWLAPDHKITYALEGSVFVAGAAVQWLRDGLGLITSASEIEELAASVASSEGVTFVPALTGLGAPHWNPKATGSITGITRGTTKAHLARATLEAIALQVRDLVTAISSDLNAPLSKLNVDGGAASNSLLMQLQADFLGIPVIRGVNVETTGLGAAYLAGLGVGIWSSVDELRSAFKVDRIFEPGPFDQTIITAWEKAISMNQAQ